MTAAELDEGWPSAEPTAGPTTAANGAAAAAILAAGVGVLALGALVLFGEASHTLGQMLNWYAPVGSLAGKSTVATAVYLLAWLLLHTRWRHQTVDAGRILTATAYLIASALLLTFPPFYTLFADTLP